MKRKPIRLKSHLELNNIVGFYIRMVTPFGNSAKVDCPREFLGRCVYLVMTEVEPERDE